MTKQPFAFRTCSIRLHPNTLVDPILATLLALLGLACVKNNLSRIAVTKSILSAATKLAFKTTPEEFQGLVLSRFDGIHDAFAVFSRIDKPRHKAYASDFRRPNPGDAVALATALDQKDDFLVTLHPDTLASDLAESLTTLLTPRQLFLAARDQIPDLLIELMEQHQALLGMSTEFYEEHLRKSGLDYLIRLPQITAK